MKISIEANINIPRAIAKVRDPKFWKFGANEWHKLITPYTPMLTGTMSESVSVKGGSGNGEIEYKQPYSHYIYEGRLMVDAETGSSYARAGTKKVYAGSALNISTTKHPLASAKWDKAAEPSQKPKLIDAMQGHIDSGRLNLSE
ncbi:MAG: hypothetical protein IKT39_02455 [Clostridia bacterium]|nr:hypothetical protein [Clostridia bacterium]